MLLLPLLVLLPCADAPPADQRPSVLVMRLDGKEGVSRQMADALTSAITARVQASGRYSRIVSTIEVEKLLGLEREQQLLACDAAACMADVAGALGAEQVLTS